jgi:hypothetical protein
MTSRYLEDFAPGQRFSGAARIRIEKERIKTLPRSSIPSRFISTRRPRAALCSAASQRAVGIRPPPRCGSSSRAISSRPAASSGQGSTNSAGPVRPGDELRVEGAVLEVRPSKSRPDQGLIKVRTTTLNQHDETVQISVGTLVVPRRASFQEISERFSPEPGLPSRARVSSSRRQGKKLLSTVDPPTLKGAIS